MYDRWFTIALLALEFGQVWARFNIEQCAKYHTTLDNIVALKTELHTTLGEIARLHNCAVA